MWVGTELRKKSFELREFGAVFEEAFDFGLEAVVVLRRILSPVRGALCFVASGLEFLSEFVEVFVAFGEGVQEDLCRLGRVAEP